MNDLEILNIPRELREMPRWVCWRLDTRGDNPTKIPIQAENPERMASSTNPATWAHFSQALSTFRDGHAHGIGFVLGEGFCGIDLDKCRDPITGAKKQEAQRIIDEISSYTEASPSGAGVHILVKAKLPDGWRKLGFVEIYSEGRYFTVTGKLLGTINTIEERSEQLAYLHKRLDGVLFNEKRPKKDKPNPEDFFIELYDSSKGVKNAYTTKVHRETGKGSCSCPGWKYRMRNGKPCWHVPDLQKKHGFEPDV